MLEKYDGREVTKVAIALTGAGDGLSKAMGVDPREFRIGDEVMILMEATVRAAKLEPVVRDDLEGPLCHVAVLRAGAATIVEGSEVAGILATHKARMNASAELPGQLSIDDDLPYLGEEL